MRFIVKVEWQEEDGTVATAELGQIDSNALQSASDVGLKLSDTKPILTQLQNIIIKVQMDRYCQSVRCCPSCPLPRRVKASLPTESRFLAFRRSRRKTGMLYGMKEPYRKREQRNHLGLESCTEIARCVA